jgi:cobalt-zinc-cadmium efflux system membrane fusion protein
MSIVARAALLGAVALAVGCARRETPAPPAPAPSASAAVAPPRTVRVAPDLVTSGRVRTARAARREPTGMIRLPADVVASPDGAAEAGAMLAGRLARFEAREGDRVKRGQVLAWLDAPEAARATAELVRARARMATLTRKLARLEGLVAAEAATQLALDEARLELELARADVAAARTLVTSFGLREPPDAQDAAALSVQLPVRSPVDGTIVERTAAIGAHVPAERPLFRLVSEGRVLVEARVAEGARVMPRPGGVAHVEARGDRRCAARVLGVLPEVDGATRSRRVRLVPDEACSGLVAGAQAEVEIEIAGGGERAIVVPETALVDLRAASVVFVKAAEPGVFEVRAVEPGLRIGDDRLVHAGVSDGEEVVVDGAVLLKGELIRSQLGGEP